MSDPSSAGQPPEPTGPEEIRSDIEQTRAELADTVDQLADKLNVKSQVGSKAEQVKQTTADKLSQAKAAAPPPVQSALDTVGAKAGPVVRQATEKAAPHRSKILGGAAAAVAVLLVVRKVRGRKGQEVIKVFYKPFGLLASVLGGLLAGAIFDQVWKLVAREDDAPDATDADSTWTEVLLSAAVHGAVFGAIKALINRAGATGFARATGSWPGNTEPRHKN